MCPPALPARLQQGQGSRSVRLTIQVEIAQGWDPRPAGCLVVRGRRASSATHCPGGASPRHPAPCRQLQGRHSIQCAGWSGEAPLGAKAHWEKACIWAGVGQARLPPSAAAATDTGSPPIIIVKKLPADVLLRCGSGCSPGMRLAAGGPSSAAIAAKGEASMPWPLCSPAGLGGVGEGPCR